MSPSPQPAQINKPRSEISNRSKKTAEWCLLSTNQEMIPARNAIDAHAQSALAQYTLLEMLDVFSLRVLLEQSVAPTNSRSVIQNQKHLAPHQTRPLPRGSSRGLWSVRETKYGVQTKPDD
jgi:hypothetical protein